MAFELPMTALLRRALIATLLLLGSMAAAAAPVAEVQVVRDGDTWKASYSFPKPAVAWALLDSGLEVESKRPWRPPTWTILTPGVRLERRGWYDVIVSDGGEVPSRVDVRFLPSAIDVEASYDPALKFSDGAVALFTDQFDVIPLGSAAEAEQLPIDLKSRPDLAAATRVSFRDRAGQVLHSGKRKDVAVTENGRSYVLFGSAKIIDSPDITTIIDPALPAWLSAELGKNIPRLLDLYRDRLGPHGGPKPMLMATWAGPTSGVTSMGGSVLPGLVLMAFEGERIGERSEAALNYVLWFIAHESAHFWIGQAVEYDSAHHAWMTEGGAELIAVRTLTAVDPAYDAKTKLDEWIATCIRLASGKPVNSANERSEHDAYYACGAVFGLVAEAAANRARPGSGFAGFWRGLIDSNRADGIVSQAEWLAALTETSADPTLARDIAQIAEVGVADPRARIEALFRRAGVAYRVDEKGALRLR
jgi:hypothetical protein